MRSSQVALDFVVVVGRHMEQTASCKDHGGGVVMVPWLGRNYDGLGLLSCDGIEMKHLSVVIAST